MCSTRILIHLSRCSFRKLNIPYTGYTRDWFSNPSTSLRYVNHKWRMNAHKTNFARTLPVRKFDRWFDIRDWINKCVFFGYSTRQVVNFPFLLHSSCTRTLIPGDFVETNHWILRHTENFFSAYILDFDINVISQFRGSNRLGSHRTVGSVSNIQFAHIWLCLSSMPCKLATKFCS